MDDLVAVFVFISIAFNRLTPPLIKPFAGAFAFRCHPVRSTRPTFISADNFPLRSRECTNRRYCADFRRDFRRGFADIKWRRTNKWASSRTAVEDAAGWRPSTAGRPYNASRHSWTSARRHRSNVDTATDGRLRGRPVEEWAAAPHMVSQVRAGWRGVRRGGEGAGYKSAGRALHVWARADLATRRHAGWQEGWLLGADWTTGWQAPCTETA